MVREAGGADVTHGSSAAVTAKKEDELLVVPVPNLANGLPSIN